jgi:hypothetical protein
MSVVSSTGRNTTGSIRVFIEMRLGADGGTTIADDTSYAITVAARSLLEYDVQIDAFKSPCS